MGQTSLQSSKELQKLKAQNSLSANLFENVIQISKKGDFMRFLFLQNNKTFEVGTFFEIAISVFLVPKKVKHSWNQKGTRNVWTESKWTWKAFFVASLPDSLSYCWQFILSLQSRGSFHCDSSYSFMLHHWINCPLNIDKTTTSRK